MSKCTDDDSARACPKELEQMTALDACKAIEKQQTGFWDGLTNLASVAFPIGGLVNNLTSKNDSIANFINETKISVDQTQLSTALSACEAQVKVVQSNLLDTTTCDAQYYAQQATLDSFLNDALKRGDTQAAEYIQKAKDKATDMMTRDLTIVQTNDADVSNKCKVNAVLSALAKADATIANTAMMDLMQKASGPMTSNSNTTNSCNKVSVSQTGCQYVSSKSCCMSKFMLPKRRFRNVEK